MDKAEEISLRGLHVIFGMSMQRQFELCASFYNKQNFVNTYSCISTTVYCNNVMYFSRSFHRIKPPSRSPNSPRARDDHVTLHDWGSLGIS